ncbi:MAG: hypothetical protein IK083_04385 [Abditibacteriota bacterium]|nr:hypothetical protein [Abditibacteriota bacterium]
MRLLAVIILLMCAGGLWAGPAAMEQRYDTEDYAICEYILQADVSGRTDATGALQGLIDRAAEAGGGVIWCPEGTYRFDGSLRLRKGVTLRGDWQSPRETGGKAVGTVFAVYGGRGSEEGPAFITMEKVTGLVNLNIWYPEQDPESISPYPWTVSTTDNSSCGYTVRNVNFVNSYKALSNGADDHMCYNVAFYSGLFGCPLKQGIYLHYVLDITRLEHIFFGPDYWIHSGLPGAPVSDRQQEALREYMYAEAEAVVAGRFDWMPMYDAVIEGYGVGLRFINNEFGCPNGNLYGVVVREGRVGLLAEDVALYGWCITGCEFTSLDRPGAAGVRVTSAKGPLMFYGCRLGRTETEEGSGAALSFMGCELTGDVLSAGGDCAVIGGVQIPGTRVHFSEKGSNIAALTGLVYDGSARPGNGAFVPPEFFPPAPKPFFRPRSRQVFSVRDFGAKGDEKTDDTRAFMEALKAAGKAGGTAYVPAGRYVVTAPLTVPSGAELRGVSEGPAHTMVPCSCIIVRTGLGSEKGAFVRLSADSSLRGVSFWYPQARYDRVTPFPWTVRALGKNCQVRDVSLGNSWQGLDFASAGDTSGHVIAGVMGCCRRRGIFVDHAPKGGYVANCQLVVHYWDRNDSGLLSEGPALTGRTPDVNNAMRRESESYVFGDCDGEEILSTFSYSSQKGLTLKKNFRGTLVNHGSDGTVFGINLEDRARAVLVNTLAAPVPSMHLYGNAEYKPLDPDNPLYVNKDSRSITLAESFAGDAVFVNTSLWGYGDTILAEGEGGLSLMLLNTILPKGTVRGPNTRIIGAYSRCGTLWDLAREQGGEAFFGSFGILTGKRLGEAARRAEVSVTSQVSDGQGAKQLTDGLAASIFASQPEDGTRISLTFPVEEQVQYVVLINTGPDGHVFNTRDLDLWGSDAAGNRVLLDQVRGNDRCVLIIPVGKTLKGLEIEVITPGLADKYTRIGELCVLTLQR